MQHYNSTISTEAIQLLTPEQAWKYSVVPYSANAHEIHLYAAPHIANQHIEELELLLGKKIIVQHIAESECNALLTNLYRNQEKKDTFVVTNASDMQFIKKMIEEAHHYQASDIHIEVFEERCRIRYRVDGKLLEKYILEKRDYPLIINKIKIEANLDIAEKRLPQDGRIFYQGESGKFDVRVSALPTLYGEKIVMRLLAKDAEQIDLEKLGFSTQQLNEYKLGIQKTHGIILISGPTGSGKTTTLYSTLKVLNKTSTNILTVEDPIEYTLEGINQVQLNEAIGLDYSTALRSFLRQDPDIIMLGEIRDAETAQMAIRSALTGHLVFSTIHTNSAWGTVSRLIDMGVPAYLLANTLLLSLAQRLLRLLCPHCKQPIELTRNMLPHSFTIPKDLQTVYKPVGCKHCYYTGYKGRKAIYEVIPVDKEISYAIKQNELDIDTYIQTHSIIQLKDMALEMLRLGETSTDEVFPVLLHEF